MLFPFHKMYDFYWIWTYSTYAKLYCMKAFKCKISQLWPPEGQRCHFQLVWTRMVRGEGRGWGGSWGGDSCNDLPNQSCHGVSSCSCVLPSSLLANQSSSGSVMQIRQTGSVMQTRQTMHIMWPPADQLSDYSRWLAADKLLTSCWQLTSDQYLTSRWPAADL